MSVEEVEKQPMLFCRRCQEEFPNHLAVCPNDGTHLLPMTPDPLIGSTFAERYQILERLGKGGMGLVYKARHLNMDNLVAIKVLWPELDDDSTTKERFQQEARAAAALKHPNLIQVFDFGTTSDGRTFLIMEYLEGTSLGSLVEEKGGLPPERALNIFVQACDGLAHAHKQGVIHRDLKPNNIVLISEEDKGELVKVVDFGIAKFMTQPEGRRAQNLTRAGEVFGSPLYMSPEQCQGRRLDARSDIYSLGCVMYETLTSLPPLMGMNSFETMSKHVQEQPLSMRDTAPDISIASAIDECVLKSLQKEPCDRQQSMLELRKELLEAAHRAQISLPYSKSSELWTVDEREKSLSAASTTEPVSNQVCVELRNSRSERTTKVLLALVAFLSCAVAIGAVILISPGCQEDPRTGWERLRFNAIMRCGDMAAKVGSYQESVRFYELAAQAAEQSGGGHPRLMALVAELGVYTNPKWLGNKVTRHQLNGLKTKIIKSKLEEMKALFGNRGVDLSAYADLDQDLIGPRLVDPADLDAGTADWYSKALVENAKDCFREQKYKKAISWLTEAVQFEERAHELNGGSKKAVSDCAQELAQSCKDSNLQQARAHFDDINDLLRRAQEAERMSATMKAADSE